MMRQARLAVALAALAAWPGVASAEIRTLASAGLWSAFGGAAEDQRPICGITTGGAEGRRITIAQFAGETGLVITLDKDSWAIPDGAPIDVAIQFDAAPATALNGQGAGRRVTMTMAFEPSVDLMRALRRGRQMRVHFPSGNETVWTGGLAGSSAAIDAFNTCRSGFFAATGRPTQPFTPAAAPPATQPTQPYAPATPQPATSQPLPPIPAPTSNP